MYDFFVRAPDKILFLNYILVHYYPKQTIVTQAMRSGIECLKRNRKNSHQQPLPGSLGKTGLSKAEPFFLVENQQT
jgi:hypothetical protein